MMQKLLYILSFIVIQISYSSAQNKSYTYERYGIINKYTNNMVLEVDDTLKFTKGKDDSFLIQNSVYTLIISLKDYDEFNEQYIYIGDAIEIISKEEDLIYKGKCLIKSNSKLDIYFKNQGSNFEDTYNKDLSFSVYFNKMRTDKKGFIPQTPNVFIRIFPIRNKTEQEKKEEVLKEKQKQEYRERETKKIRQILSEVNIEQKVSQIKNNIIQYDLHKTKELILNTPIKQLLREKKEGNKTVSISYEFELYIDKDKNLSIIKDKHTYLLPYYGYDLNNPLGDSKERRVNPTALALKDECENKYFIDNQIYYKKDNDIFSDAYEIYKKIEFETDIIGVKIKKNDLKYYSSENRIPQLEMIHNWCSKNITDKGLYFIHYIIINGKLTCRILNLNKEQIKHLKQYLKIGLLNRYD